MYSVYIELSFNMSQIYDQLVLYNQLNWMYDCYCTYVTGFRKIDHIVTIDIARNTDLKY